MSRDQWLVDQQSIQDIWDAGKELLSFVKDMDYEAKPIAVLKLPFCTRSLSSVKRLIVY